MARQTVITPEYKIALRFKQNGKEYTSLHYNQDPIRGIGIAFEQAFSMFHISETDQLEIEEIRVIRTQPFEIEG